MAQDNPKTNVTPKGLEERARELRLKIENVFYTATTSERKLLDRIILSVLTLVSEEVKKDSERLDWLSKLVDVRWAAVCRLSKPSDDLRSAIDRARGLPRDDRA